MNDDDDIQEYARPCQNCEYHRQRAQLWRDEAYKQAGHPLPEREQEPIGYASEGVAERLTTVKQAHEQIRSFRLFTHDVPLYTTPPPRTWVGLTDGEVDKMILLMGFPPDWITENAIVKNIVRNLEAKLKEKNT